VAARKGADKDSYGRNRLTLYSSRDQRKKAVTNVPRTPSTRLDHRGILPVTSTDSRAVRGRKNQQTIQRPNVVKNIKDKIYDAV
jgi:hypothetical protein